MLFDAEINAERELTQRTAQGKYVSGPKAELRQDWNWERKESWIEGWSEGFQIGCIHEGERRLKKPITPLELLEKLPLIELIRKAIELRKEFEQRYPIND